MDTSQFGECPGLPNFSGHIRAFQAKNLVDLLTMKSPSQYAWFLYGIALSWGDHIDYKVRNVGGPVHETLTEKGKEFQNFLQCSIFAEEEREDRTLYFHCNLIGSEWIPFKTEKNPYLRDCELQYKEMQFNLSDFILLERELKANHIFQ